MELMGSGRRTEVYNWYWTGAHCWLCLIPVQVGQLEVEDGAVSVGKGAQKCCSR